MPENPYTRSVSVTVTEYVPDLNQLPRCHGWKADGTQCRNRAKYKMDDRSVCAVHIKPNSMFMPQEYLKSE